MLVPIVFILSLLLTLTTALLGHSLAAAKIATQLSVSRYSEVAVDDGVAAFTGTLAAYVKLHGSSGPWPAAFLSSASALGTCGSAATPGGCVSSRVVGSITDATTASVPDPTKIRDDALSVQTSAIAEGRISAMVTATISTPSGTVLGSRTRLLTYRVFEAPPYAIISGARSTAAGDGINTQAPGDSGGRTPTNVQTDAVDARTRSDTRIHVQLTCKMVVPNLPPGKADQLPAGNDSLPWGVQNHTGAYELPCGQSASPADNFADAKWTNGNATGRSGWTP